MTTGIYAYWDNENNYYAYVGKDSYIDNKGRHKAHLRVSQYDKQQINRVVQNNPERYEYHVLMEGDYSEKQLNKMEKFLIKHLKTFKPDYPDRSVFNFTKGGEGTVGINKTLSEETKQKISESHKRIFPSEETKKKMSKSRNTTGYYRVYKLKDKTCKQGFIWSYQYYEEGKRKCIRSVSIEKLEQKVKAKGLEWRVI